MLLNSHRGDKLIKLQDRIVKNLFSRFYPNHSLTNLYVKNNILKLQDIYRLRLAVLFYQMLHEDRNPDILAFINPVFCNHNHFTRQAEQYYLPFPRVQCLRESLKYQMLSIWNELTTEITSLDSLNSFKNACHEFYISKY